MHHIPEDAWNDIGQWYVLYNNDIGQASGGGVSQLFPAPGWQKGLATMRSIPDLAFAASAGHDGYLQCWPTTCVNKFQSANGGIFVDGGTSAATPLFAGIMALVDQKLSPLSPRQGNINPRLYEMAQSSLYGSVFHDVIKGNNFVSTASGGSIGYQAGPGFDLVTGWGSVNAYAFASAMTGVPVISNWSVSPASVVMGGTFTVSYSATDSSGAGLSRAELWRAPDAGGTPGTWSQIGSAQTLSGTGPIQVIFTDVPAAVGKYWYGTHIFDSAGNEATEPAPTEVVAIAATAPTATTGSATSISGTNATLNGTVNPNGAVTQYQFLFGTSKTLAVATTVGPFGVAASASSQPVYATASNLSAGNTYYYELQAWNGANSSSNPTNGGILSFTTPSAAKSTPLVSVAASSQSITTTQLLAVSVVVVGNSVTPTGSVTLSGGGYNSSAPLANGSALFNISAGQLLSGSDTLTATYAPDSASSAIYNSSTGNTTVSVTTPGKLTPTVAVSPLSTSITTAQSVTVNVSVYTNSGPSPTGTVAVTMGSFTSQTTPLTNGSASVIISGKSISPGTYTPAAHYSGDSNYNSASGTANNSVTVTAAPTATLAVSVTGSGSVTSTDGHIICPGTCSYGYAFGSSVLLIANKASDYYDQWSGCDAIDGTTGGCMLTMSQSRSVSIVFTQQPKGIMLVQPGSFTFPAQVLGTSSTAQPELVIANGGAALDQVFASLGGPNTSDFALSNQCQAYGVNSNCYLYLTFTPTGIGARTASLTVSSANATITPQVYAISGAGVVIPTVSVTQSATAIAASQALILDVSVSGPYGTPTGSLTVYCGSYRLTGVPLSAGSAVVTIPGGSLTPGSDVISIVYYPDTASSPVYLYSGTGVSVTVAGATSYSAPTEPVGTQSQLQSATIVFPRAATLGTVTATTMGAVNLDFHYASGGTCAVGTAYTAEQSCTVDYIFTPSVPGTRMGALNVYDNSSPSPKLVSTVYLNGIGTGPQIAFLPGTQSTILPLMAQLNPGGIALDGSGNLYIADIDNNEVLKESLSGGKYTETAIGSGWNSPVAVAVDGAGNVYVAESGMNRVVMETLSAGSYMPSTVASGLGYPSGVAVDGSGNVYIADSQNNLILMEALTSGGYVQSTIPTYGLSWPNGVAVDGNGSIYIADQYNNRVLKETLSGSSYTQSTIISSLNNPRGVAVDANGDVYIADSLNNEVVEETPKVGGYVESTIGSGVSYPCWVTLDGSGNLYISGYKFFKEDISDPPSISFETTANGSTSTDSPKGIAIANVGNASLVFSVPSSGNNPSISSNFTVDKSTTCPQLSPNSTPGTLLAGTSCVYTLDFSPTIGGSISGSLSLSDNNLNAANGEQAVPLSGAAVWVETVTVTPSFGSITTLQTLPVTIAVSGGAGSPTPTGSVILSSGSYASAATTLTGGSATINIQAGLLSAGTDTLTAIYTPDSASAAIYTSATGTSSPISVTLATQTITFANPGTQTVGTPLTLSATATSGLAVSFTSTTTGICTVSGITATFIASGTCIIDANQAGNSTYAAAPQVQQSFTVNGKTQTITFGTIATQTVGTPLTFSATATSGLAVAFTSTTTSICTVSGTTATFIASGTCTIDANQAGNSTYAAAPMAPQSFTVNAEPQTISFANPGTQTVGTPLTLSATATSGLAVAFTSTTTNICTVSGTTAAFIASGTCTINANQAGNSTYAAAPMVAQNFSVNAVSQAQTITFANPGTQTVGTPLTLAATATSGLAVSFTSITTGICTVSGTTATFIGSGTCTINANQAGNSTYAAATMVPQSFIVNAEAQTITFANPGTQTVGTPLTLSATATSSLVVSFTSTTTGICTVSGTTATFIAAGTCTINANQAGNSMYAAAPQFQQSFTVNTVSQNQTITFANPGTQTVGTPLTLSATATSGLAVSFTSSTAGNCTVSGITASFIAVGTCIIDANQAGNSTYAAAPQVQQSFTVNGKAQNITFGTIATQTVGTPLTLAATATSGLAVSFTSATINICTVSGTTATFLTSGTCTIDANQAGNNTYAAATMVPESFAVNAEAQTVTFANPGTQTVGTPLTLSAAATSGLAISFTSTTANICTVSGTAATFIAAGTCTIDANQAGNGTYAAAPQVQQSFSVNAISQSQTITFTNPGTQTVGTPLTLSATATSGLVVAFNSTTIGNCTVSGNTATFIASGTCIIDANQAGNSTYAAATMVPQSFTVNAEPQTITFGNPGTQTVGIPLMLSATATSGLAVGFTSTTTGICTVSGITATFIASGTCTIDANQAGNSTYASATMVPQSFMVNGKAQTVSFGTIAQQTVGTPLTLSATATSGLAVVFTSTTTNICTVSGITASFMASGTCTIDANQAGNSTYAAATTVPQSFTVNAEPQTIAFANPGTQTVGTPLTLSATATSGLVVSFTSTTTGICTVSGTTATFIASGTCTIDANQAGNSLYAAAPQVQQNFSVNAGSQAQTITFANPGTQTVGTPLTLAATATSGLAVSFTSATTNICTVSGTTATFIASGTCTIDANQAGNSLYAAAPQVQQNFSVNAGSQAQTITFANPGTQTVGTPLTLAATATSGLAVSFTSATTNICTVSGTTATFIASGTCTIDANQAGNSTYAPATMVPQSFTVNGKAQTITFGTIATQTVGTPLTFSATATSGLAVAFTSTTTSICTVSGTTATFIASGTCTIDANQAGNSTYAAALQVQQSFAVNPTPTFTGSGGGGTISIKPGAATGNAVTISVAPSNGFTGVVSLSCSIGPAAASDPATCSLAPTSVTIGGSAAQTSTLTIYTTAASSAASPMKLLFWPATGGTSMAVILLFMIPRRRRNWLVMPVLLALFVSIGAMGCGGGGSNSGGGGGGGGNAGTSPGTYTVTVTGTSGSLTVTLGTVTLVVQ